MRKLGIAISLMLVCGIASAAGSKTSTKPSNDVKKEIVALEKRLATKYPNTKFASVTASPIAGVYEVVAGKNLMYTDVAGKYFLFGSIFDMEAGTDLSADRRAALTAVDVKSLPIEDALVFVKGNGTHKIYVFSDPDCPYCKRAEQELTQFHGDITIYTFMMPLTSLHPNAETISESIWCSSDRNQAWLDYMLNGKVPDQRNCDNPIQRNKQLGSSLNINGTPTFIDEDGKVLPGAPSADQLARMAKK